MNRQRQAWNDEFLIHTRDLTKILANCGASTVNLSIAPGKIIPPITVRIRGAENLSAEKGTGWKLKDVIVSERRVCRISKPREICGIAENLRDSSVFGNDGNRVSFIGVDPNISGYIERYAISTFKDRMSDEDVAQAERVVGECSVAVSRTLENSLPIELNFPKCTARSIDDQHLSLMIEGNTVGD